MGMTRWYPWGRDVEEPVLTTEDRDLWSYWSRTWRLHARTSGHARRVDAARRAIDTMLNQNPRASVAFSCGKDSTALMLLAGSCGITRGHIICSDVDMHLRWKEYCRAIEKASGASIREVWPQSFSERAYIEAGMVGCADPVCSDNDPLARKGFFDVARADAITQGRPGLIMGLRAEENKRRRINRKVRGLIYPHSDYGTVCNPLSDWTWLDVYGYMLARDVEPFHVYYCLRRENDPKMRRLDGWLPGEWVSDGAGIDLRIFYPSLFDQWSGLFGRHVETHA